MSRKVEVTYHSSSSDDEHTSDSSDTSDNESDEEPTEHQSHVENAAGKVKSKKLSTKVGSDAVADVMAKILGKQAPAKTSAILCKGDTDKTIGNKRKQKESQASDEETETGIKKEKLDGDEESAEEDSHLQKETKKMWENMGKLKPSVLDREKEKQLQRIATRGVVQLFNAVKKQQKLVEEKLKEVGSSEHKKEKVMQTITKGKFLDVLKGTAAGSVTTERLRTKRNKESEGVTIKQENDDNPTWSILREDFMMGAKMKDWDRKEDEMDDSPCDDLEDSDADMT